MSDIRYVSLDTETTGIGPEFHRLTEIAAIDFNPETGEPTGSTFHTFLNPEREVPEEVVKVHGKTWDDLKDEPLFKDKAEELLEYVKGTHVVIHNAPFDVGFINAELKRIKLPPLEKVAASITDTLALSRRYRKARVHTLDSLCDAFGIDRTKRVLHGAFVDCELLSSVYPHLMALVRRVENGINELLPFKLGEQLPETIEEAAQRWLKLDEFARIFEREKKRYAEHVKLLAEGIDHCGEDWEVEFSTSTTTNWEKVVEHLLQDVDLKPYQTKFSRMSIRRPKPKAKE